MTLFHSRARVRYVIPPVIADKSERGLTIFRGTRKAQNIVFEIPSGSSQQISFDMSSF